METSDEISSLARDIAKVDGEQAAPGIEAKQAEHQERQEQAATAAQGWAEIPAAVGLIVGMALPGAKAAFSDEACDEWGKHMAKVAEKYGWSSDGLPPEVAVIICSAGMVLPVMLEVKKLRNSPQKAEGQGHGQALAKGGEKA